jgi:thiol-disulfide isomerase/thioredoxin
MRNDLMAMLARSLMVLGILLATATIHAAEMLPQGETFKTLSGKSIELPAYQGDKVLVVAITNTTCPLCKKYAPRLAEIEDAYADRSVAFLFVNPATLDVQKDATDMVKSHGFEGEYALDPHSHLITKLNAKTTTEVFVYSKLGELTYRGAVDDQYGVGKARTAPTVNYLRDALDATLKGTKPALTMTEAPGCLLAHATAPMTTEIAKTEPADVTYFGEIAHILQQKCNDCHRAGGVAPFSLTSINDVLEHKGMIEYVLNEGIMPPWFADPEKSALKFRNDMSLSANQKTQLLAWLKSNHPMGDPKQAPQPKTFHEGWNIGEPDLIVELPDAIDVKAQGTMGYQHVIIDPKVTEDKWIESVEIRPTDPSVVHHVLVFNLDKDKIPRRGGGTEEEGFFAAYVPGNTYQTFPDGLSQKLAANSKFLFQMHYTPNGKATSDRTKLGIKFKKTLPEHNVRVTGIANTRISIPPNTAGHKQTAIQTIPRDVQLLSLMPHMHLRGQAFRYEAIFPDQSRVTLLEIPRYDFNWQIDYKLKEPFSLPKGSQLELTAWYDNSSQNVSNPDPDKQVKWGPQTYDEMLVGYVSYYNEGEDPLNETSNPEEAAQDKRELVSKALKRFDKNRDGKITRDEAARGGKLFDRLDADKNGEIDMDEAVENFPSEVELLQLLQDRK